jgi:hypothetical protein
MYFRWLNKLYLMAMSQIGTPLLNVCLKPFTWTVDSYHTSRWSASCGFASSKDKASKSVNIEMFRQIVAFVFLKFSTTRVSHRLGTSKVGLG